MNSLDEINIELDEAMCKHFMELIVVGLKHLIAFAKGLPGFLQMTCEDQAALVKGKGFFQKKGTVLIYECTIC